MARPHVPHQFPVVTNSTLDSFLTDDPNDPLYEHRLEAFDILYDCYQNYHDFFEKQKDRKDWADLAKWAIQHTDHTTLRPTRNENKEWVGRMVYEATTPYDMRGICMNEDYGQNGYSDKLGPLIKELKSNPQIRLVVTINYPHGDLTAKESARRILELKKFLDGNGVKNAVDVDTVLPYQKWIAGDIEHVRKVLKAEGEACKKSGFTWKSIQMVSVHARSKDFFKSIYNSSMEALNAGADFIKTSTGLGAKEPDNDLVPSDTGQLIKAISMIMAVRDFNAEHNARRTVKFSGGNKHIADAVVLHEAAKKLLGEDLIDDIAYGTSYRFRHNLLMYINRVKDTETDFDARKILTPHNIKKDEIPLHRLGPDPNVKIPGL